MPRQTPPRRPNDNSVSRRKVLTGILFGGTSLLTANTLLSADAFTSSNTDRQSTTAIAEGSNGLIGLLIVDTVQRNQQSLLGEVTNNADVPLTLTVSLDNCEDGELTGPNGDTACAVTFSLGVEDSAQVQLETGEEGEIPITITGNNSNSGFSFSLQRQTVAEAGQGGGEVSIDRIQQFRKQPADNEWTIRRLNVSSDSHDLDRIEITVRDLATGDIVSTRTISPIDGQEYEARGATGNEPGIRLSPDDPSYTVQNNREYELTVIAYDTESNIDLETRTD